jgi:hypothetical protein
MALSSLREAFQRPFTQVELAEKLTIVHPMPGKASVLKFPDAGPKT